MGGGVGVFKREQLVLFPYSRCPSLVPLGLWLHSSLSELSGYGRISGACSWGFRGCWYLCFSEVSHEERALTGYSPRGGGVVHQAPLPEGTWFSASVPCSPPYNVALEAGDRAGPLGATAHCAAPGCECRWGRPGSGPAPGFLSFLNLCSLI